MMNMFKPNEEDVFEEEEVGHKPERKPSRKVGRAERDSVIKSPEIDLKPTMQHKRSIRKQPVVAINQPLIHGISSPRSSHYGPPEDDRISESTDHRKSSKRTSSDGATSVSGPRHSRDNRRSVDTVIPSIIAPRRSLYQGFHSEMNGSRNQKGKSTSTFHEDRRRSSFALLAAYANRWQSFSGLDMTLHRKSDSRRLSFMQGGRYIDGFSSSYRSSDRLPKRFENTFQLGPTRKFPRDKVAKIILEVLEHRLEDVVYQGKTAGSRAMVVSDELKERIKSLHLTRFKIVCWVVLSDRNANNMRIASRGVWDNAVDSYAEGLYENETMRAVAVVYGIYQE